MAPPERFPARIDQTGMSRRLLILAIAASFAALSFAQPPAHPGRIPTVTRLVKVFSQLEQDLVAKAHAKAPSALDSVLDPAFEMREGTTPGVPVPREAWMREARASADDGGRFEQMAVHDFGDVALVSFRAVGTRHPARDRFIVDCWKRDGQTWKLAVRYQSDVSRQAAPRAKSTGTIDKRY